MSRILRAMTKKTLAIRLLGQKLSSPTEYHIQTDGEGTVVSFLRPNEILSKMPRPSDSIVEL